MIEYLQRVIDCPETTYDTLMWTHRFNDMYKEKRYGEKIRSNYAQMLPVIVSGW